MHRGADIYVYNKDADASIARERDTRIMRRRLNESIHATSRRNWFVEALAHEGTIDLLGMDRGDGIF